MGAGKTVIGRALAERLDRPFFDSDHELERTQAATAAELAETTGVAALHQLELDILQRMLEYDESAVIAAAASVVDTDRGMAVLTEHHALWLDADAGTLARRSAAGDHRRPIPGSEAEQLRAQRIRRATQCTVATIDTDRPIEECLVAIVATLGADR